MNKEFFRGVDLAEFIALLCIIIWEVVSISYHAAGGT